MVKVRARGWQHERGREVCWFHRGAASGVRVGGELEDGESPKSKDMSRLILSSACISLR